MAFAPPHVAQRATLVAQLLPNPLADGHAIFDPLTIRPYGLRPRTLRIYILGGYAGSKSKTNDKTAFAVLDIDTAGINTCLAVLSPDAP